MIGEESMPPARPDTSAIPGIPGQRHRFVQMLSSAWFCALFTAITYFLFASLSASLSPSEEFEFRFWLPGGLAIGILLSIEPRRWPITMGSVLIAELTFNFFSSANRFLEWVPMVLTNAASVLLGAWLVRRSFAGSRTLDSIGKLVRIVVLGGMVPPLLSATVGTLIARKVGDVSAPLEIWGNWYVSDVLGVVLIVPMMLLPSLGADALASFRDWRRSTEALILVVLLVVSIEVIFATGLFKALGLFYLIFPFVLWAGVRFGRRPVALISLVTALLTGSLSNHTSATKDPAVSGNYPSSVEFQVGLSLLAVFGLVPAIVIAGQRKTESALRASEERWKFALEGAGDGVWDWNIVDNKITRSNRWKEMLGYGDDEVGADVNEFTDRVHPDDVMKSMGVLNAYFENRTPIYADEVRLRHKDGTWRWILTRGMVTSRDSNGRPLRMIGTHTDITARKQTEQGLIEANQRLKEATQRANDLAEEQKQASAAKSEFLASMSHEIRTPLNGILGFTNMLLSSPLSPEQQEYALTVQRSGEGLMTIINDILDISKIEAGKLTLEFMRCDLTASCADIVELLASQARKKNIELIFDTDFSPAFVIADPGRLRQVLFNLVGNAIKFTERGRVIVEIADSPGQGPAAPFRTVRVRDTGIGIDKAHLPLLFQKFSQTDPSMSRRFGGTGLGLAISRNLIHLMDGEIACESERNQGSTFSFSLPRAEAPAALNAPQIQPSTRVLIVAQSDARSHFLHQVFSRFGIEASSVDSTVRAAEELRQKKKDGTPYSALLFDSSLPRDAGDPASRLIFDRTEHPFLRRVALDTGNPQRWSDSSEASRPDAVVTLPLTRPSTLFEALGMAVGEMQSGSGGPAKNGGSPTDTASGDEQKKPSGPARVLLVEDNPVNQLLASRLLEKIGCRVDIAANGLEACEMTEKLAYDMIFMDWQMPEMDGLAATRFIREREDRARAKSSVPLRRLPIVILTANAMAGDRAKCLAAGADDYLSKPFLPDDLRGLLHRYTSDT
jgi:PAS domain S-box-containing protein